MRRANRFFFGTMAFLLSIATLSGAATGPDFSGPVPEIALQAMWPVRYRPDGERLLNYRRYVTPGIPKGMKVPLVVFLHGAGERGDGSGVEFYVKDACLDLIRYSIKRKMPVAIFAPQCQLRDRNRQNVNMWVDNPDPTYWPNPWNEPKEQPMTAEPSYAMRLVWDLFPILIGEKPLPPGQSHGYAEDLAPFGKRPFTVDGVTFYDPIPVPASLEPLPVDTNRIYVTGLSIGGYGTWDMIQRHPGYFAAALPICGGGDKRLAPKIASIPIWTFHCVADHHVPFSRSKSMVDALRACGGKIRFTEISAEEQAKVDPTPHLIWGPIYRDDKVWDWLFSQRKE